MLPPSWKGEIEKAVEEKAHTSAEGQKAEAANNAAGIPQQIKALVDAYNTQHDKPERKDKLKRFLDIATVVLLFFTALFTGLAWLVFRGQLWISEHTDQTLNNTMVADIRAWVVPTGIYFDDMPKAEYNQRLRIAYENVGKEAATDVDNNWSWSGGIFEITIDAKQMPYIDVGNAPWPKADRCNRNPSIVSNRRTAYPSAKYTYIVHVFNDEPYVPQSLIDGTTSFYIYGCFIYRSPVTAEKIHHSPYCLYYQPKRGLPITEGTFEFCPSGSRNPD